MLKLLALALLLANAGCFAWGQGLLAAYGPKPARQIRPEALQLITPVVPVVPIAPATPRPEGGVARGEAGP